MRISLTTQLFHHNFSVLVFFIPNVFDVIIGWRGNTEHNIFNTNLYKIDNSVHGGGFFPTGFTDIASISFSCVQSTPATPADVGWRPLEDALRV